VKAAREIQRPSTLRPLHSRIRSGALWGALNVAAGRIVQFVSTLIVARIIAPEHFGALAVATVIQMIALNISELGATTAIARADRDPDEVAPTVFTIALLTSATLTAIMLVAAPSMAALLGDPEAAPVIRVLSIAVALSGVSAVPTSLVWREYLQGPRLIVDVTSSLVTFALVVVMALSGWEALALAWSRVGGQLVSTIGYWVISPRVFLPGWNRNVVGEVLRMGLPLAASNLVVFATLNVDYVVVGRELGSTELGLYMMAFNLASLPSMVVTTLVRTVAVPTFGRMFVAGRLGEIAEWASRLVSLSAFVIAGVLAGVGTPLISALYGQRWAAAGAAMLGLAVFGIVRILTELYADLSVGAGKTSGLFWVQLAWLVALVPVMYVFVTHWGIAGAGFAHAVVAAFVVVPLYLFTLSRQSNLGAARMLRTVLLPLAAGVACALAAHLVSGLIAAVWPSAVAGALAGAAVYAAIAARPAIDLVRSYRTVAVLAG
jgi:PST family polysaccharide transporter